MIGAETKLLKQLQNESHKTTQLEQIYLQMQKQLEQEVPLHQTHEKDLLQEEEKETQKETLFQQLLDNRIKQQQLRQRIKHLMETIHQLE